MGIVLHGVLHGGFNARGAHPAPTARIMPTCGRATRHPRAAAGREIAPRRTVARRRQTVVGRRRGRRLKAVGG